MPLINIPGFTENGKPTCKNCLLHDRIDEDFDNGYTDSRCHCRFLAMRETNYVPPADCPVHKDSDGKGMIEIRRMPKTAK